MAQSKCPKCDNTTFESKNVKMVGGTVDYVFIQCYKCGCVVGVIDTASIVTIGNSILRQLPPAR